MKVLLLLFAVICLVSSCDVGGCTDPLADNYNPDATWDDGSCIPEFGLPSPLIHSGTISTDETWSANIQHVLMGKVVVESGVTLTIEPGTIIKAEEGNGALISALIIAKGATINACGTAQSPIIFTSVLDNIQFTDLTGTSLTSSDRGLWGGLIILGDAPISSGDGDTESQVEGQTSSSSWSTFGGHDPLDNSGSLCYVSIRHTGALLGAGNELGGLSLGGVGSGTQISNIEIFAGLDDGIDIYGGTVNVSNLIIGYMGDDAIDLDYNYDGQIMNFVVVDGFGDEGIEADGPEGATYTDGSFELINGTFLNFGGLESHHDFKQGAKGSITNVDFGGTIRLQAMYDATCSQLEPSCLYSLLETPSTLTFTNIARNGIEFRVLPQGCSVQAADQTQAESLLQSASPTGNSNTDILWTWHSENGIL